MTEEANVVCIDGCCWDCYSYAIAPTVKYLRNCQRANYQIIVAYIFIEPVTDGISIKFAVVIFCYSVLVIE